MLTPVLSTDTSSSTEMNQPRSLFITPIQRYPEDILREIFLWAVKGTTEYWFGTATIISHVCQRWRTIALDLSILWTRINISSGSDIGEMKAFLDRTEARTRIQPVQITIYEEEDALFDRRSTTKELLEALVLDRFPSIAVLGFILSYGDAVEYLIKQNFSYSAGPLRRLVIQADEPSIVTEIWDWERFANRFPTLEYLEINNIGHLSFGAVSPFPSLRKLELSNIRILSFDALAHLTGLEDLHLYNVIRLSSFTNSVTLPNLAILRIGGSGDTWTKFITPQLRRLGIEEDPSDKVVEFIKRHPSIDNLDAYLSRDVFKSVADALPFLKTLVVEGFLEGLWNWETIGMEKPPFPRLTHLTMTPSEGEVLLSEEFEKLVQRRCSISSSTLEVAISPLDVLEISEETEVLMNASWRQSELLEGCTQTIARGPNVRDKIGRLSMLTIRWPH